MARMAGKLKKVKASLINISLAKDVIFIKSGLAKATTLNMLAAENLA